MKNIQLMRFTRRIITHTILKKNCYGLGRFISSEHFFLKITYLKGLRDKFSLNGGTSSLRRSIIGSLHQLYRELSELSRASAIFKLCET